MKFARDETLKHLANAGPLRRKFHAFVIAAAAYTIVTNMVHPDVYANAGLDPERALRAAKANEHHKAMLRASCSGLMEFLASAGLLTKPALVYYKRANLI